jgi:hypothetical protein
MHLSTTTPRFSGYAVVDVDGFEGVFGRIGDAHESHKVDSVDVRGLAA